MGDIVSGFMSADAASDASDKQTAIMKMAQANIQSQMDPAVVNAQALAADQSRAKNQLALQAQIDPALASQRPQAEQILSGQLGQIGQANSDQVANAATQQALAGTPGAAAGSAGLVAAANQNLAAGATLPPDVQAQLMQSGLEQTGAVQGSATARGAGGPILQQILGLGGIQLQQQRQQQAASLLTSASNLDAQRSQVLGNLFPRLQQQQMGNIGAASGILQQSNSMLPQAGLSGADVANVWLQRVGAVNSLTNQMGSVVGAGALAAGQARAKATGSAVNTGVSLLAGI
jgi:hypothetical protein